MIRAIYGVVARSGIEKDAFQRFWDGPEYCAIIDDFARIYRAERLEKNLCLRIGLNDLVSSRQGIQHQIDGIIEAFWSNAAHVMQINESDEANQLKARWSEAEMQIVDRQRSFMTFTTFDH